MKDGRIRLERALDVDDRGQRLVADDDGLRGVLGQVAVARDDQRHRLADEARLVGGGAVVAHRRGHAHREGPGVLDDVLARHDTDHAFHRERGGHVVAEDARVGIRRPHDRRVVDVRDGRVIVDEGAATGQEPRVLDALDGLSDPAHRGR